MSQNSGYASIFFNSTTTTEFYTLSLHDALPIFVVDAVAGARLDVDRQRDRTGHRRLHWLVRLRLDRKSTRLNSSHQIISYAVFCLKKKSSDRCLQVLRSGYAGHAHLPKLVRVRA